MFKKTFLTLVLIFPVITILVIAPNRLLNCSTAAYGQNLQTNSLQNENLLFNFNQLSQQQLYDTANYYFNKYSVDTALICYSLIINTPVKDNDMEQRKRIIDASNRSAVLYCNLCDYRNAYKLFIDALLLSEKYNIVFNKSNIYNNIGIIYQDFKMYDIAKSYYLKAFDLCLDSVKMIPMLNNLGTVENKNGKADSAFYFLNRSLKISKRFNDTLAYVILHNIAEIYEKTKQYDSAFYYYRLALKEVKKNKFVNNHSVKTEVGTLSKLGNLFFEVQNRDSALFYINLSNTIAADNHYLSNMADNYLTLAKIEETKGNIKTAFERYKIYSNLKDSIYNTNIFGDINQLQRLYEISKTNQQIEQLIVEQKIKEKTIYYQKIIWMITLFVLLLVSAGLLYIYIQKKNLSKAYKVLFEKNMEIIELQDNLPEKYKKCVLSNNMYEELLEKILTIMEDRTIICNTEFSLDKLAELVQSNRTYVSQVINVALKKNFRSFLNTYRIREAQRLISETDATKYTIDSIALKIGFKSQSAFYEIFKEITGVSPTFYLKSILEQNRLTSEEL